MTIARSEISAPVPRLALTPDEAAASIGVSPTFFGEHIRPELRLVRRGRKILVPLGELQRWIAESAADRPVAEDVGG